MVRLLCVVVLASLSSPALARPATPAATDTAGLSPELPAKVYAARRARLSQKLGGCAAALESFSTDESRDADFVYLTGVTDPGAVLVLAPRSPIVKSALYLPPRDPEAEIWTGYREEMSAKLREKYAVDDAGRYRGGLPRALRRAMRNTRCVGALRSALGDRVDLDPVELGKLLTAFEASVEQRWQALERMRAVKQPEEIARMERAIAITFEGHRAAARATVAGAVERQVAARIEEAFYAHGATGVAFPSIVGSGENGAILHWFENDRTLRDGDLVVVDIGSSFGGYASDITRTYPVSGTFSPEQRKVYDAVLAAQEKVIAAVRPGISLEALHRIGERAILDAGYELPHGIGHFVGLEVHDVGDITAPLEPGMVITVEPGIYIKGKLGVRIEDEVLVTGRGHRHLTAGLPRAADEIEAFVAAARK